MLIGSHCFWKQEEKNGEVEWNGNEGEDSRDKNVCEHGSWVHRLEIHGLDKTVFIKLRSAFEK